MFKSYFFIVSKQQQKKKFSFVIRKHVKRYFYRLILGFELHAALSIRS